MTYRYPVRKLDETGGIVSSSAYFKFYDSIDFDKAPGEYFTILTEALEEYRGKRILGTNYIEFDTEEDAAAFVLRWS